MATGPIYNLSQLNTLIGNNSIPTIQSFTIFTPSRVKSIVLDSSHEKYNEVGQENGIGTIFINPLGSSTDEPTTLSALPLFPNVKSFPLVNEIVYTLALPSPNNQLELSSETLYYINPVNIWNHPHHNAIPFSPPNANLPSSQTKDYQQVEAGSVRRVTDQSTEIKLGNTFIERSNIHPLTPFEGDVIHEGRWGNSIRLGSTVVKSSTTTPTYKDINQSYKEKLTFNSNGTIISPQFKVTLEQLNTKVAQFVTQYPKYSISVSLLGQESQVPNPPGYSVGDLAITRVQNLEDILFNYPYLDTNITANATVGPTPYIRGIDNPNDPKYTNEQFAQIQVSLQAKVESTPISTPSSSANNWSNSGASGDPITIIRNGQSLNASNDGWVHITENINDDLSSLYLTSTQQLPIIVSSLNYYSYSTEPISPQEYTGNQIVLNSDRLLFNSKTDHILLSSPKSISLSSLESVNIDTSNLVIQANELYLGSKNATEPVLLGDTTVELLFQLLENLATLTSNLSNQVGVPEGVRLEPTATVASLVNNNINDLIRNINDLKSKYVKTV